MDFKLNEQQNVLRTMVQDLARTQLEPNAAKIDEEAHFPQSNVDKMKELMLLGMTVPGDFGGAGMDCVSYTVTVEELARKCMSTAMIFVIHNTLAAGTIMRSGTDAQKQKWLPELASGAKLGAYGVEDTFSNKTPLTAVKKGSEWVLSGTKQLVMNAPDAQVLVVSARTGDNAGRALYTLFVLDAKTPGVTVQNAEATMGVRGVRCAPVSFANCTLPADAVVGAENGADKVIEATADHLNLALAAAGAGLAQESLDQSISYSKQRVQFGKPIAAFPAIQWKLVKMAQDVEGARLMAYNAAAKADAGEGFAREAALARCASSEMAAWAAVEAVQVHGGFGYTKEAVVERHFRDSRILAVFEGTSEDQKARIARMLLK